MPRRILALAALALALALAANARGAEEPPGSWIQRMTRALWPSDTVHADITLRSKDELGEGLDMQLRLVRAQHDGDVRTQIRVLAPGAAAGTVYEISSRGGRPLQRSVYLAASRRTHDLSGIRRTDAFMGSEFSYEDLEIAAPVDSEWKEAERVREGGRSLVRVTSAPYSYYARVETLLDPKTFLPVRVSYYDRSGALYKRETFGHVRRIDGHPLPTRIEMDDVQTGEKSVLVLHDVRLREPIDENVFAGSPIGLRNAKR